MQNDMISKKSVRRWRAPNYFMQNKSVIALGIPPHNGSAAIIAYTAPHTRPILLCESFVSKYIYSEGGRCLFKIMRALFS